MRMSKTADFSGIWGPRGAQGHFGGTEHSMTKATELGEDAVRPHSRVRRNGEAGIFCGPAPEISAGSKLGAFLGSGPLAAVELLLALLL
ncbi:hypothetical protein MUK42_11077 [Musa troglodytarum]|uniref:Uncharacterized protein n=1 Tax=Musa troglodytarum TaxID=320322 RepID=A0A9E7H1M6_9LILI|nr:hypothetical protein MUK42_11077 [Musa troglodytarum]